MSIERIALKPVECWPWSLRFLAAGSVRGGSCHYCRRDVAVPNGVRLAVCPYCALERGIVPAIDSELRVPPE